MLATLSKAVAKRSPSSAGLSPNSLVMLADWLSIVMVKFSPVVICPPNSNATKSGSNSCTSSPFSCHLSSKLWGLEMLIVAAWTAELFSSWINEVEAERSGILLASSTRRRAMLLKSSEVSTVCVIWCVLFSSFIAMLNSISVPSAGLVLSSLDFVVVMIA